MTLRDEFAKAALTGMVVTVADCDWPKPDNAAKRAYEFADAMIRARESARAE